MTNLLDLLISWAPLAVLLSYMYIWTHAFVSSAEYIATLFRMVMSVSVFALLIAGGVLATTIVGGSWQLSFGHVYGLPILLQIDTLSALLLTLSSLIGAICLRYSRSYLAGDPRQADFIASMALTVLSVFLLVLSGSLLTLWLAWVAVSLSLHRLLVFFGNRQAARAAARKKLVSARLSDILLLAAFLLLADATGTSVIADINLLAAAQDAAFGSSVTVAMLCLALAAALKSAQLPLHSWLTEVMETPTPVSALLHAGIVNAGGFLVLRFADVMLLAPEAMTLLIIIGGITALLASTIMLYQPAVKTQLAWSTIAQMGFMLMQCGFGAFALATLHIIAHSFYKAHAFLSSGSAVEVAATRVLTGAEGTSNPMRRAVLLVSMVMLAMAGWSVFSLSISGHLPAASEYVFSVVLAIGLGQFMLDEALADNSLAMVGRLALAAIGLGIAYLLTHDLMAFLMAGNLPDQPHMAFHSMLAVLLILGFTGLAIARGWLVRPAALAWRVHLANGLYLGAWLDRLVKSYHQRQHV